MSPAATAMAAKPSPPLSIDCSTLSKSGNVYSVACTVLPNGAMPEKINFVPSPSGESFIKIIDIKKPDKGIGKWIFTVEQSLKKGAAFRFEAIYSGGTSLKVATVFSPAGLPQKAPKRGRILTDKSGRKIQDFPSQ